MPCYYQEAKSNDYYLTNNQQEEQLKKYQISFNMQRLCIAKYCNVYTNLILKWFKVSLQKSYFFLCSLFMSLSYMAPQHVAYISFLIRYNLRMCCTRKEYFKCYRPQNIYKCSKKIRAHIQLYLIWMIQGYKTICQHNVISYEIVR